MKLNTFFRKLISYSQYWQLLQLIIITTGFDDQAIKYGRGTSLLSNQYMLKHKYRENDYLKWASRLREEQNYGQKVAFY